MSLSTPICEAKSGRPGLLECCFRVGCVASCSQRFVFSMSSGSISGFFLVDLGRTLMVFGAMKRGFGGKWCAPWAPLQ